MCISSEKKCSICCEFEEPDNAFRIYPYLKKLHKEYEIDSRILYDDRDFVIIPSLGPVSECHLLVLPRLHINSFALLDPELLSKAGKVIYAAAQMTEKRYGGCIIFEHGTLNENLESSASCDHAHMHIVACSESLIPYLKADGLQMRRISDLCEIREQSKKNLNYFYYQEFGGDSFIMDDTIHKSQYMRILVSNMLGNPEKGDWEQRWGIAAVGETIKKMKDEIKGIGKNIQQI